MISTEFKAGIIRSYMELYREDYYERVATFPIENINQISADLAKQGLVTKNSSK